MDTGIIDNWDSIVRAIPGIDLASFRVVKSLQFGLEPDAFIRDTDSLFAAIALRSEVEDGKELQVKCVDILKYSLAHSTAAFWRLDSFDVQQSRTPTGTIGRLVLASQSADTGQPPFLRIECRRVTATLFWDQGL